MITKIRKILGNNTILWGIVETCKKDYYGYFSEYKIAKKKNPGVRFFYDYIRWIYTLLVYGASASDYFVYEFWRKSMREINSYVTRRRRFWFMKKLNVGTYREPVEDKVLFADMFSGFTKREIYDGNQITYAEFRKIIEKHRKIIVKPRYGFDGKDIFLIECTLEENQLKELYKRISGKDYVLEEVVKQTGVLHELNPETVNTIRVNVLQWKGECLVVDAILRVGGGDGCVDNLHSGGVAAAVDLKSGIVGYKGKNLEMDSYILHPLTQKQIVGVTVPQWDKVLETARKAARIIEDVPYTSWDIAVSEKEIIVIEGNTYGNTKSQQISDEIGKWKIYKEYTKKVIRERKRICKNGRAIKRKGS